ncbi:helix-turn-helix domain-containing protein [Marinomonas sp. THO17]|uniref:helix-turn-helix domain-containing protein n=1 Tax=Marinomonas sp. THO17 TaxID=3149048 RepID=UPI00336BFA20
MKNGNQDLNMVVKTLRLQRGWSQDQLSQLSGLSVRTIQRIEKGSAPGLESLKSLAAVFGVSINDLQGENTMTVQTEKSDNMAEKIAEIRVNKISHFYKRSIRYGAIICVLFVINVFTNPGYIWAVWPLLGLGISLAIRGLDAFGIVNWFGPEWEKRQLDKQLIDK